MTTAPESIQPRREHHRARWALVVFLAALAGGLAVALLYQLDVLGESSGTGVHGSGVAASKPRAVAPFTSVDLAGSNNVVIRAGEKQSVVVHADANLLDHVTTTVQSRTLVVANTPGSFTTESPMRVEVTVPALTGLTLSGSGNVVVDGIAAKSLTVSLPGSGTLTGSGTADRLDVTVSGSGEVQFLRLVGRDVRAVVSGSGAVFVTATERLDASVTGSGAILYAGSPASLTKDVTGTGAIIRTG